MQRRQRVVRLGIGYRGADLEVITLVVDALQFAHIAEVHDVVELAQFFGDEKPQIGAAREQNRTLTQRPVELGERARRAETRMRDPFARQWRRLSLFLVL